MKQQESPEVIFGSGKSQISLRGREAIRAAGWALRLLLFAKALRSEAANSQMNPSPRHDDRAARSPHPPLRYHRDRQRQLALQEPSRRSTANPRSRRLRNPDQLRRRERYRQNPSAAGVFLNLLLQERSKMAVVRVKPSGVPILDRFAARLSQRTNEDWAKWLLCR
jgi:hypothetical protein